MVRSLFLTPVVAAVFLTGCGHSPPPLVPVKGTVTVDTQPLADGAILFLTPGQSPETLPIKEGAFEGKVSVGDQRVVQILGYTEAAPVPMEGADVGTSKVNYLPAKYNTASELKADVKPQGPNEFKYDLKYKSK